MVGTTGLPPAYRPPVIQIALLLTQEAPRRLRRRHFAFPFACESELSPLPEKQNPQLSLRASCSSGRQDSNLRPPGPKPGALPACATSRWRRGRRNEARIYEIAAELPKVKERCGRGGQVDLAGVAEARAMMSLPLTMRMGSPRRVRWIMARPSSRRVTKLLGNRARPIG